MTLKLGVVGISEGNGHPYSWSAIFNGYDQTAMAKCGFPIISEYLAEQQWPQAQISHARVTYVWTQSPSISNKIARAALIENVVANPNEMISQVGGVLLARDDAETHLALAAPFLDAGLPVYVDKPLALSVREMERLYSHEQYPGQIFSCSALRYASELRLTRIDRESLGEIHEIHAITPKSWDKYALHIIEPVLGMLQVDDVIESTTRRQIHRTGSELRVKWRSGVMTTFSAMGDDIAAPLAIRVMGTSSWKDLFFRDSFNCFRAALYDFVSGIDNRSIRSPRAYNEKAISLVEAGRIS